MLLGLIEAMDQLTMASSVFGMVIERGWSCVENGIRL